MFPFALMFLLFCYSFSNTSGINRERNVSNCDALVQNTVWNGEDLFKYNLTTSDSRGRNNLVLRFFPILGGLH